MTLKLLAAVALLITVAYQVIDLAGLADPPPPDFYSYGDER